MTHEGRKIKIGKNLLPTPEFSHNHDVYLKFGEGERIKKKTKGGKKKKKMGKPIIICIAFLLFQKMVAAKLRSPSNMYF